MKYYLNVVLFLLCISLLSSCATATKSTFQYKEPDVSNSIQNKVVVNISYDECWKRLVSGLSSEFFVITNIEKASGLITLDFSTQTPELYVDCGESKRTYGDEDFSYKVAADASYPMDVKSGIQVAKATVVRDAFLSGKINILVSEVSNGVQVTVNARYIFNVNVGGTYRLVGTGIGDLQHDLASNTYTKTFNTNSIDRSNGPDDFTCRPTGELEATILNIISNSK